MNELSQEIEKWIPYIITFENVVAILTSTQNLKDQKIKEYCIDFIAKNYVHMEKAKDFQELFDDQESTPLVKSIMKKLASK